MHVGLVAAADGSADLRANSQGTSFVVTGEGGYFDGLFYTWVGSCGITA